MVDLAKIKRAEGIEHWRQESLTWWRMYLKNLEMIRLLREQNRKIRKENCMLREVVTEYIMEDRENGE